MFVIGIFLVISASIFANAPTNYGHVIDFHFLTGEEMQRLIEEERRRNDPNRDPEEEAKQEKENPQLIKLPNGKSIVYDYSDQGNSNSVSSGSSENNDNNYDNYEDASR